MRDIPSRFRPVSALIVAAILAGCGSQPQRPIEQPLPVIDVAFKTPDQLLIQAEQTGFPESAQFKIEAAEKLFDDQMGRVKGILESIPYDPLPPSLKARLALMRARIAEREDQNWEVFHWLDREAVITSTNQELLTRSYTLRAKAFNRYGEYLAALDEWLAAIPQLKPEQQAELYPEFWNTLLHVPYPRLEQLSGQTRDRELRGWLELAMLYSPGRALDQQLTNLQSWQQQWASHPARIFLPENLDNLKPGAIQPRKIALLLPTSGPLGKAGKAVRDGFMAAYYASAQADSEQAVPEVLFLNTHNNDIVELAQEAKQQEAELIIGPLEKNDVARLQNTPPEDVIILALNYSGQEPGEFTESESFFQFGLSTEDEARVAARRGIIDGHRRAIIFSSNSSWSKRATQSFISEWEALKGEVANVNSFDSSSEYSKLAGEALLVDQSQERARQVSRTLRERIGFEPRRRQDVDMVFMTASPEEARQIKPALAYQFAGNLPTYATSNAYSGRSDRSKDQDLDNLRVPVMPWHIPNHTSPLKDTITATWPSAKGQYGSLFALGADSFSLHPRLQQLHSLTGSRIDGLTGWLSIDQQGRVSRELSWQIFRNGRLTPLPIPVQEKDVLATQSAK